MLERCVLGKVCLLSLGKLCLVARSRAREKQVIQHFLLLPFLIQLIGVAMPLSQFAENLTFLARGLIDGQLRQTLRFKLPKQQAQPISRHFELQLALHNFHEMSGG